MRTQLEIKNKIKEHKKLINSIKGQMNNFTPMSKLLILNDQIISHSERINILEWVLEIPINEWYEPNEM